MIGKHDFARQATTLMKLAGLAKDPQLAAGLTDKATDLKDRSDQAPSDPDALLIPPDVQKTFG
jgi:hypothetical protein